MVKVRKSYRIVWRPLAEGDLLNIIDYIAQDSPVRAISFGQELRDKTLQLAHHPNLGKPNKPPIIGRLLVLHPNYVVFYRVLTKTQTVEILRVKHAAQQRP